MDIERAEAAVAAGYPAVEPILFELLEWLQDLNWPVAQVIAPFLATIGSPLVSPIRRILQTDDEIWKRWILTEIVEKSAELASAFRDELARLADSPTETEIEAELDDDARYILEKYGYRKKSVNGQ
jgi:hypothetical protein